MASLANVPCRAFTHRLTSSFANLLLPSGSGGGSYALSTDVTLSPKMSEEQAAFTSSPSTTPGFAFALAC